MNISCTLNTYHKIKFPVGSRLFFETSTGPNSTKIRLNGTQVLDNETTQSIIVTNYLRTAPFPLEYVEYVCVYHAPDCNQTCITEVDFIEIEVDRKDCLSTPYF